MKKGKPKPKWGYKSFPDRVPFTFSDQDKQFLQNILAGENIEAIAPTLISDLEDQLGQFIPHHKIETERPKRSNILAALDELQNYSQKLAVRLRALDSESTQLLAPHLPSSTFRDDEYGPAHLNYFDSLAAELDNLQTTIHRVTTTYSFALPSAKGGGTKSSARRTLAANVAKILRRHTGELPSATRGNLYESILLLCINAATGSELEDIHDLACEVLKAIKEEIPPP